jgi:hypothetical protein
MRCPNCEGSWIEGGDCPHCPNTTDIEKAVIRAAMVGIHIDVEAFGVSPDNARDFIMALGDSGYQIVPLTEVTS